MFTSALALALACTKSKTSFSTDPVLLGADDGSLSTDTAALADGSAQ